MQFRAVVCSALFAGANAVSAQAEVSARVWMLDHPGGNPDELSELKAENPDAYALVKALLTKRSLGLLDPRHPTASFAPKAPAQDDGEDHPTGAAMYAKFATTEKEKEALQGVTSSSSDPYPDAPAEAAVPYPEAAGGKKDWMNWKPKDGAMDDEAMVKNVLGAVADLTKGKNNLRGAAPADDANPLAAEAANQMQAENNAPQQVVTTTAEVTQAPANENPYLKVMEPETTTVAAVKAADPEPQANSALSSFSFDDDSQTTTTTTAAPKAAKGGGNPLASWLGLVKPHVKAAAPQEAKPSNPYLMDLQ